MAHSPHTTNLSQFPEFDIHESLAGFWVIRTVGDRVQLVDRFVERVDAERFVEYLIWQAGRLRVAWATARGRAIAWPRAYKGANAMMRVLLLSACCFAATAQAQPATLSLSCKGGLITSDGSIPLDQSSTFSMGVIVDFAAGTVQGVNLLSEWNDYPIRITSANDAKIVFKGHGPAHGLPFEFYTSGTIDRVTGELEMQVTTTGSTPNATFYGFQCKPAQRMF